MSNLIILAGQPGSGKSTFANNILSINKSYNYLSVDEIKEYLFDTIGFRNLDEKRQVEELALSNFYEQCEYCFNNGIDLIIDYPFSDKQKEKMLNFKDSYNLTIQTYVLYGDPQILFERVKTRSRNKGHDFEYYFKQIAKKEIIQTYDEYIEKCNKRNYKSFTLGKTTSIDTSRLKKENYINYIE